jgi:ADP-heptose:LPS heptosyltransferase
MKIVIYHNQTGAILKILPNTAIYHRAQLLQYVSGVPLKNLSFFYEQSNVAINTAIDRIAIPRRGNIPTIIDPQSNPKAFNSFLHNRRNSIMSSPRVLCNFEGGMGDQLLESAAALEFYRIFPQAQLALQVSDRFIQVIRHVAGLKEIYPTNKRPPNFDSPFRVEMHTRYMTDPRPGLFGKASLYGASLGLKKVHTVARLDYPRKTIEKDLPNHLAPFLNQTTLKIGIHIRSASGHAKSWNYEPAEKLAAMFIQNNAAIVAFLGAQGDFPTQAPSIYHATDKFTWHENTCLIATLNLLICIDSGPMHISNSLGIPNLILWGGTTPQTILGRALQANDHQLDIPCKNNICYTCPSQHHHCMKLINPEAVYAQAIRLICNAQIRNSNIDADLIRKAAGEPSQAQPWLRPRYPP